MCCRWIDRAAAAQPLLAGLAMQVGADWRQRMADPAWRSTNSIAQPLVTALALAAWQCIAGRLPPPEIVAGYSVGELAAFAAAGVFSAETALDLAVARAAAMDRAAAALGFAGGLMAVDLPRAADFAELAARFDLRLAIDQAAGRQIVGGPVERLTAAAAWVVERGGLARPLEVRVPSHTPWLQDAATAFAEHLQPLAFARPQAHLALDATGRSTRQPALLRQVLAAQIAEPVRWRGCSAAIAERGVVAVLEVGPGTALARLWRDAFPDIPARSVDEFRDADAAADWLLARLD